MADHRYAHPGDHGRLCREDLTSIVVSKFAAFRYRPPSELRNQNDTRNQYVASVLSIPKFAKRRYREVANFGIGTLAASPAGGPRGAVRRIRAFVRTLGFKSRGGTGRRLQIRRTQLLCQDRDATLGFLVATGGSNRIPPIGVAR